MGEHEKPFTEAQQTPLSLLRLIPSGWRASKPPVTIGTGALHVRVRRSQARCSRNALGSAEGEGPTPPTVALSNLEHRCILDI